MSQLSTGKRPRPAAQPATAPVLPDAQFTGSSMFVNGFFPQYRWIVVLIGIAGGIAAAWLWNSHLADQTIGFNTANAILGHDANTTPIGSIGSGVLFAFVSGLAGSFTACNIAAFGAMGPLVGQAQTGRERFMTTIRPLGWLAVGMIPVSAVYGFIVGIVGTHMPQFSTAKTSGFAPRTIQSMTAFGICGLVMVILGLAASGVIRDPLARISRRVPAAPMILLGAVIGGFLIGRPYPLFRDMFRHAATSHNPFYGAAAFVLQSIGNILVMAVLFIALSYLVGRPLQRWLMAKPSRAGVLTTLAFVIGGVFMLCYWDLRVLSRLGYIWFPPSPW
jgi:hypothetical protein